ncbi:hypothetical protein D3C78_1448600 [compost metagenome]
MGRAKAASHCLRTCCAVYAFTLEPFSLHLYESRRHDQRSEFAGNTRRDVFGRLRQSRHLLPSLCSNCARVLPYRDFAAGQSRADAHKAQNHTRPNPVPAQKLGNGGDFPRWYSGELCQANGLW